MKILIIAPASLRDVVFATPVIRALKMNFVNAEIHCRTSKRHLTVLQENPFIDKLITDQTTLLMLLSRDRYLRIIDFALRPSTLLAGWIRNVPVWRFSHQRLKKWLFSKWRIKKISPLHITDRWLKVLEEKGVKGDGLGLDYFLPERDEVPLSWLPESFQKGYVVLYLRADFATRKLPLERIIELCDKINKPIVLLGGAEDIPAAEKITRFFEPVADQNLEESLLALNKKTVVYHGVGKFNVNQQAYLSSRAGAIFTFDSEMIAIGSAFKKQLYVILGNTVLSFGEYPYQTRFVVIENNRIGCRPCTQTGHQRCPLRHFSCMRDLSLDF